MGKLIYCDGTGVKKDGFNWICIYIDPNDPKNPGLEDDVFFKQIGHDLTSNEAEWLAMIQALKVADDGDVVLSDSQLVVNQLNGVYQVKAGNLKTHHFNALRYIEEKDIEVRWIQREQNLAGIQLDRGVPSSGDNIFVDMKMDNTSFRECISKLVNKFEEQVDVTITSLTFNREGGPLRGTEITIDAVIN